MVIGFLGFTGFRVSSLGLRLHWVVYVKGFLGAS